MTRWGRWLAATLAGLVAVIAVTPVFGSTTSLRDVEPPVIPAAWTLAKARSVLEAQLLARVTELGALSAAVANSATLSGAERNALGSLLGWETKGIATLQSALAAQTTIAGVRSEAATMVLSYHVFSFVQPVVTTVLSLEGSLALANRLSAQLPALQAAVSAAHLTGSARATLLRLTRLLVSVQFDVGATSATIVALSVRSVPASLPVIAAAERSAARATYALNLAQYDLAQLANDIAYGALGNGQHMAAH